MHILLALPASLFFMSVAIVSSSVQQTDLSTAGGFPPFEVIPVVIILVVPPPLGAAVKFATQIKKFNKGNTDFLAGPRC